MEPELVCLILLSLSGLHREQRAAALPAFTVQVRAGEDATLQCPLLDASNRSAAVNTTGAAPGVSSALSWYRKAAGRRPQLLLTMKSADRSKVKYGSGVRPDKVSAAADGSLLLRRSEQKDSAVYYCGISQGDENKNKARPRKLTRK